MGEGWGEGEPPFNLSLSKDPLSHKGREAGGEGRTPVPKSGHQPLDNQNNCSYYGLCQVYLRCQSQRSITATRQHQNRKPA